jgi:hypothetical protein
MLNRRTESVCALSRFCGRGETVDPETKETTRVKENPYKWRSGHCIRLRNKETRVRIPPVYKVFREA